MPRSRIDSLISSRQAQSRSRSAAPSATATGGSGESASDRGGDLVERVAVAGPLGEDVDRVLGAERVGDLAPLADQSHAGGVEEVGDLEAGHAADRRKQLEARGERADAEERRHPQRLRRHQLQPRRGDDAERPLAADQERGQVIAGVVLQQAGHPVDHGAVGEHRLEADDAPAHRPVGERQGAAGVGGDRSADSRRGAGAEVERELEAGPPRGVLHPFQAHPGTGDDLAGGGVDLAERVEPRQAQHQLAVARHPAADHPGVAALRDQRQPVGGAGGDDRRHLVAVARPGEPHGAAAEAPGEVDLVAGQEVGIGGEHPVRKPPPQILEDRREGRGVGDVARAHPANGSPRDRQRPEGGAPRPDRAPLRIEFASRCRPSRSH